MGNERGFSLLEVVAVISVMLVLTAASLTLYGSVTPSIRADGQVNRLLSLLQRGREAAVARQRNHEIRFDIATSTIDLVRIEGDDEVMVERLVFEYGVTLMQFEDAPDTPELFGDAAPVDFGNPERLLFTSEGSLVDETGFPINGTVFLGIAGSPLTARAITITGTTGRARFYVWNQGSTWEDGWLAR